MNALVSRLRLWMVCARVTLLAFCNELLSGLSASQPGPANYRNRPSVSTLRKTVPTNSGRPLEVQENVVDGERAFAQSDREPNDFAENMCQQFLGYLPNDLTRLIYLASLRDCNTDAYFHSLLSERLGISICDSILRMRHLSVFQSLLSAPIHNYVQQLQDYIRFSGVDPRRLISTWHALRVYYATVPIQASPLSARVYLSKIETALAILELDFSPTHKGLRTTVQAQAKTRDSAQTP